jgi:hypothetical protein
MFEDLENVLDECFDALAAGGSVDECLERHPELASELEPLLRLGQTLKSVPSPKPSQAALHAALVRVGSAERRENASRPSSPRPRLPRWLALPPVALRAVAAATFILLSIWGVGTVSARAQPGDLLYPLKLATDRVWFGLTLHPEGRAELRLTFADARLAELVQGEAESGGVSPALLEKLLHEAERALDELHDVPDARFELFLKRLGHFNAYQQETLAELAKRAPSTHLPSLQRAIGLCEERRRWIRQTELKMESGGPVDRKWGAGCRCR